MNFIFFISLWILVFTFLAHSEEKQVNFKIIPNLSYSTGENPRQTLDLLIPDPKAVSLKKTLPLVIYQLMNAYRTEKAMASAVILVSISIGIFLIFDRIGKTRNA